MGPAEGSREPQKHVVDFADAATVLHDERAITVRDDDGDEERDVTIGMDALGNVLVVVYTWRGERPRVSTKREPLEATLRRVLREELPRDLKRAAGR
jgi:uncharacterized DUF497 family protein